MALFRRKKASKSEDTDVAENGDSIEQSEDYTPEQSNDETPAQTHEKEEPPTSIGQKYGLLGRFKRKSKPSEKYLTSGDCTSDMKGDAVTLTAPPSPTLSEDTISSPTEQKVGIFSHFKRNKKTSDRKKKKTKNEVGIPKDAEKVETLDGGYAFISVRSKLDGI
mmetsp:Transcript_7949/g.11339  ORF Transcript_7949/g.11339 Transcript_7949/m.11339 type:complete len:164 (-) Transcript_7949:258-749(-)